MRMIPLERQKGHRWPWGVSTQKQTFLEPGMSRWATAVCLGSDTRKDLEWGSETGEGRNLISDALISGWALWATGAQSAQDPRDSRQHTPEFSYPRTGDWSIDGLTLVCHWDHSPAAWQGLQTGQTCSAGREGPQQRCRGIATSSCCTPRKGECWEHVGGHWACPCQFPWLFLYLVIGLWVSCLAPCNVVRETQNTFKDLESLPITTD